MPTSYGVLNTQNFQQLIADCASSSTLKNQVKSALQSSVSTFLSTYFTMPETMIHLSLQSLGWTSGATLSPRRSTGATPLRWTSTIRPSGTFRLPAFG